MRHETKDPTIRITNIALSREQELKHRRRRYSLMMTVRGICVIGAAAVYGFSPWLSLLLIAGGAVIPWCAVLLANDRPRKRTPPARETLRINPELALRSGDDDRTVDG